MANSDNKINISDSWKSLDSIKINIGDTWKDVSEGYINIGDSWKQWWTSAPAVGDRGVFIGGENTNYNVMDYITISSPSGATDFGDLTALRTRIVATSNGGSGRGVFAGGFEGATVNTIEYITISTPSSSTDFGDLLSAASAQFLGACSNGTNDRGVFTGSTSSTDNVLQYITISSTGNATNFGDLFNPRGYASGCSNATNNRGIFGAGYAADFVNFIDYITISSASNATNFGDLTVRKYALGACSNGTNNRGIFGGGAGSPGGVLNSIDYITINSASNATNFGDLTVRRQQLSATSNGTNERGVFGGGRNEGSVVVNTIDYITINSPSDATDFGDLTVTRRSTAACSNA